MQENYHSSCVQEMEAETHGPVVGEVHDLESAEVELPCEVEVVL